MNLDTLKSAIISFRDERNWRQFHTLKDLLIGLNIECAELSELFLWKSQSEVNHVAKEKIEHELADIFIFLNYLAAEFDINLEEAVMGKLKINADKYPVDKSYGNNKKYDCL